jgi:hypothetical protein
MTSIRDIDVHGGQEVGDAEWFNVGVAGGWEARLRRSKSGFGLELQLI